MEKNELLNLSREKMLVIINEPKSNIALNAIQTVLEGQKLPEGVQQIFDNILIIDIRKCFSFFISLLHILLEKHTSVAVFAVDDAALIFQSQIPVR
jgi:hypothetical protein